MPNSKTWIVVSDSSNARIYAIQKAKFLTAPKSENLELVTEYTHEKSREANRDLVTDRQGSYGAGRYSDHTLPKEHEFEVFAIHLAKQLDSARTGMQFKDLILVAPSHFMGLLNKHISDTLNRLITQRIEKDYTHFTDHELASHLVDHF